jgi:hypothetical protein
LDETLVPQESLPSKVCEDRIASPVNEREVPWRASASTGRVASRRNSRDASRPWSRHVKAGGTESVRTGASQGAAEIGTPAAFEEPETDIEKKQVELEREERVAQQQASDPTAEIVGRLFTSARNSVVLCAHAEKQLPLQEVVLYPPFLPALCHRLAMPQIAVWRLPQYEARETEPASREELPTPRERYLTSRPTVAMRPDH